jgi:hypothetical protein
MSWNGGTRTERSLQIKVGLSRCRADGSCIDCLDRTNVVQSAIARRCLSLMLAQLGLSSQGIELERAFNDSKLCHRLD